MISLYSGTPGSGKSLHQAKEIKRLLRSGRPVIANFDVNLPAVGGNPRKLGEFYYIENSILRPELLIKYSQLYFKNHKFKEGSITLFVDECQLLFNAREWNTPGRKEWLSFFSQHRKFGYNIILIAQYDRMIDRQVRCLLEYEVIHRKVSNIGTFGWLIGLPFGGSLFVFAVVWYPMKTSLGGEYFIGKKSLFKLYDTYGLFEGGN